MALPALLPWLTGAALGAGGAIVGGLGGTKKEYSITKHAPYETYSPQTTDARVFNIQYPSYQVQIDSPLASQTTKKEMTTTQDIRPEQTVSPQNAPSTTGTDMTTIAIIAAVALIAYGVVSRK